MSFQTARRRGSLWEDTLQIGEIIKQADFNTSGKGERDFEIYISSKLKNNKSFSNKIITQYNNDGNVSSAYFFGKNHRPDISIGEYGTAIELKFIDNSLNGVKNAIGQTLIYRLKFKFSVLILVVSQEHKELYERTYLEEEPDLNSLLRELANNNNIFSIIKPAFKPKKGLGETISFFPS